MSPSASSAAEDNKKRAIALAAQWPVDLKLCCRPSAVAADVALPQQAPPGTAVKPQRAERCAVLRRFRLEYLLPQSLQHLRILALQAINYHSVHDKNSDFRPETQALFFVKYCF
jgi:hypothetical protein